MTTRRQYSKAPITEAVIDIRVRASEAASLDDLHAIEHAIRERYPSKQERSLAQGRFEIGKEVIASAAQRPIGFLFRSEDGKQVFQAALDGFTMSRLAPYESWAPFRDEGRRLWDLYRQAAKPQELVRLAVRFINRIDIPLPFDDLKEYLRTFPEVSPELRQPLAGLFMRLTIPQPDIGCVALLNEALVEPPRPDVASIILDIDLYREADVPQESEAIWEFFELLHARKNDVFEACITDKSRELFQ